MIIAYSKDKKNKDVIIDIRDCLEYTPVGFEEIAPKDLEQFVLILPKTLFLRPGETYEKDLVKNLQNIRNNPTVFIHLGLYAKDKKLDKSLLIKRFEKSANSIKTLKVGKDKTPYIAVPLFNESEQYIQVSASADNGKHMCYTYGGIGKLLVADKASEHKIVRSKKLYLNFLELTEQKFEDNQMTR